MIAVARERAREYPVIFAEKRLLFAVFPEDPVTGQILLAGPVVSRALSREQLIEVRREWNMGKTDYQPPVTSIKNGFDDASAALAEHRCYDERG